MNIVKFDKGDILVMKKPHPCKNNNFLVLRGGSDVKLKCTLCGREINIHRLAVEKNIKKVIKNSSEDTND